ncbi:hypothetical protein [Streptomyces aureoversilis]|uniref:Uncharacterized protein n=1 Tax=Streptomyces aureoversilis TaxID=67277 RepID=A0ABW0ADS7_9ACTN
MRKKTLRAVALLSLAVALTIPAGAAVATTPSPDLGTKRTTANTAAFNTTATAGTATAGTAAVETTSSSIQGKARMGYPVDGHDIRVSVDARSTFAQGNEPLRSWGTFRISHKVEHPGGEPEVYWGDFKVDCLTTGGPTATVTGTLERTSPGHPWRTLLEPHVRMGVSFYVPEGEGGGPARIGMSGAPLKEEKKPPLTPCMAPAADSPVVAGGYTLKDRK